MVSINRRTLLKGLGIGSIAYVVYQLLPIARDISNQRLPFLAMGIRNLISIGFEGVAYATTPDYTVDGNEDNVQVQQALNDLPATGGEIVLYAGTYSFLNQVSRAIDNVTIRGGGKGTIVNRNGADPVFSAGSRSGWLFLDFATDAGGINVASAIKTYRRGVWINEVYTDDTMLLKTFTKNITSAANAGAVTVATITTQSCDIKSITVLANAAQTADLTGFTVTGGTSGVVTFIDAVSGVRANIAAADQQVSWVGMVTLAATKTIVITLSGGGATAVNLQVTIEYTPVVSGGYLV